MVGGARDRDKIGQRLVCLPAFSWDARNDWGCSFSEIVQRDIKSLNKRVFTPEIKLAMSQMHPIKWTPPNFFQKHWDLVGEMNETLICLSTTQTGCSLCNVVIKVMIKAFYDKIGNKYGKLRAQLGWTFIYLWWFTHSSSHFYKGVVGPVNLLRKQLYITCAPRLLAKHGNRWQQFMGTHLGGEMGWWEFKSKFWTPVIEFSLGSNFKTNNSWNLVFEEFNAAIWGFCLPPPYVTISTPSNSQIRSLTTPPPLVIVFF